MHVVAPAVSDSPEIVNKRMVILSNTGAAGKIDVGGDSVQLRKGDGIYITLTPGTKVDVEKSSCSSIPSGFDHYYSFVSCT